MLKPAALLLCVGTVAIPVAYATGVAVPPRETHWLVSAKCQSDQATIGYRNIFDLQGKAARSVVYEGVTYSRANKEISLRIVGNELFGQVAFIENVKPVCTVPERIAFHISYINKAEYTAMINGDSEKKNFKELKRHTLVVSVFKNLSVVTRLELR